MTRPERAQVILEAVDKIYPVPGFYQNDVKEAIVKAQVLAGKGRFDTPRYQALIIFMEIDKAYPIEAGKIGRVIEAIRDTINGLEAQDEKEG